MAERTWPWRRFHARPVPWAWAWLDDALSGRNSVRFQLLHCEDTPSVAFDNDLIYFTTQSGHVMYVFYADIRVGEEGQTFSLIRDLTPSNFKDLSVTMYNDC